MDKTSAKAYLVKGDRLGPGQLEIQRNEVASGHGTGKVKEGIVFFKPGPAVRRVPKEGEGD